jgi:hypothetical protein
MIQNYPDGPVAVVESSKQPTIQLAYGEKCLPNYSVFQETACCLGSRMFITVTLQATT